jgi:hypothetical protein
VLEAAKPLATVCLQLAAAPAVKWRRSLAPVLALRA